MLQSKLSEDFELVDRSWSDVAVNEAPRRYPASTSGPLLLFGNLNVCQLPSGKLTWHGHGQNYEFDPYLKSDPRRSAVADLHEEGKTPTSFA